MDVDVGGFLNQSGTYDYYEDYEYKEDFEVKHSEAVLLPVLFTMVLVVGLLGNALLLIVLVQKRQYLRISDIFILHLGVADVLLLMTLPFWAVQAAQHSGWCFGTALCKICGAVFNINFYCGMFLLVCISLDRYLSFVHSIQLYAHKSPLTAHFSCLLVWLISLLLTTPDWIFLMPAEKDSTSKKTLCVHKYSKSVAVLCSRLLHHIVGLLLPAAILIITCSCIVLQLKRSSKDLQKQKAVTVILPLVVVFFLCWMPYNITLIVDTYRNSFKEPYDDLSESSLKTALMVTSALGCIHACLRPLLYVSLCGNFRKRVLDILRCITRTESKAKSKSSLWELGVGEEALPDQSKKGEEEKHMKSDESQVHSTQC